ncbi:MAG TPA: hypothetical protein VKU92_12610, partial [Acidimicrobiales bacterium]|nr:hypothetical protein [Acidimicrobiales bacterium]
QNCERGLVAQLLPNGTAVIGWGASPYLSVFSYEPSQFEASLVLDARLPDGWTSYRGFAVDWNGSSAESEMALAVLRGVSSGQFVAVMSWNGATDVAAWQVEASTGGGTPNQVALVPRTGFETSAAFTADGATQFSAVASDAFGKVLGTTRSVTAAS